MWQPSSNDVHILLLSCIWQPISNGITLKISNEITLEKGRLDYMWFTDIILCIVCEALACLMNEGHVKIVRFQGYDE